MHTLLTWSGGWWSGTGVSLGPSVRMPALVWCVPPAFVYSYLMKTQSRDSWPRGVFCLACEEEILKRTGMNLEDIMLNEISQS